MLRKGELNYRFIMKFTRKASEVTLRDMVKSGVIKTYLGVRPINQNVLENMEKMLWNAGEEPWSSKWFFRYKLTRRRTEKKAQTSVKVPHQQVSPCRRQGNWPNAEMNSSNDHFITFSQTFAMREDGCIVRNFCAGCKLYYCEG